MINTMKLFKTQEQIQHYQIKLNLTTSSLHYPRSHILTMMVPALPYDTTI